MELLVLTGFWEARPECLCAPRRCAASPDRCTLLHCCFFHTCLEPGDAIVCRFSNALAAGLRWGGLVEGVADRAVRSQSPALTCCAVPAAGNTAAAAAAAAAAAWCEPRGPWSSPSSSCWPYKPGTPRLLQGERREQVGRRAGVQQPAPSRAAWHPPHRSGARARAGAGRAAGPG